MSQSPNEIIAKIKADTNKLDDGKVYYTLREFGFKPIRERLFNSTKAIIAANNNGIKHMTAQILSSLVDAPETQCLNFLHNLGDKKVLIWLRESYKTPRMRWVLNPDFLRRYNGETN
jgi:hypothetical protein